MIRAEDLMIGDWVMDTRSNTPLRVNPFLTQLEVPEWEPIPLTPEILEKNGWALWEIEGEYKQMDIIPIYGRKAPFSVFDGVEINYVHELQHALRLCGIEKEIVV